MSQVIKITDYSVNKWRVVSEDTNGISKPFHLGFVNYENPLGVRFHPTNGVGLSIDKLHEIAVQIKLQCVGIDIGDF